MKFLIKLNFILLLLFNSLLAGNLELNQNEIEYLKHNEIVLGVDNAYAPMNFINEQKQIDGITIDYIKIIEKKIAKEIKLDIAPWVEILDKAMNHKIDGIINVNITSQRAIKLNFTKPYVVVPFGYITLNQRSSLKSIDKIQNQRVAVKRKTVEVEILKEKFKDIDLVVVDSYQEALTLVTSQKVDGLFGQLPVIVYDMKRYFFTDLKIALTYFDDQMGFQRIGVNKSNPLLLSILNKAIHSITQEEKEQVAKKWIFVPEVDPFDYELLLKVLFATIAALIFLTLLNYYLKRKIDSEVLRHTRLEVYLQKIMNNTFDAITTIDEKGNILTWNKACENIFGYKYSEVLGQNLHKLLMPPEFIEQYKKGFAHFVQTGQGSLVGKVVEIEGLDKEGNKIPIEVSVNVIEFENKRHALGIIRDLRKEAALEEKTIKDRLTSAYNREFFEKNIQQIIVDNGKSNRQLGVAILDIDHFKDVNDTFGHKVGDSVLIELVARVEKFSRKDDIFIRWGGEEFLLLLKVDTQKDLKKALEHIRKVIELEEFKHAGRVTCSIGGSIYHQEDIYSTIERADRALYQAKNSGRNKVVIL